MARTDLASQITSKQSKRSLVQDGLLVITAAFMAITLYLVFFWVPTDQNLGISQRILYFHVPISILALSSIVIVAVASFVHLVKKHEEWDSFAYAGAEVGMLLASLSIITGAMWGKPTWGTWWTWDPKLTLTLVLWFVYVGYLMLRAYGPKGSQGARYGAVVALIGAIDAPIVYYAANLWRTTHPSHVVGPTADSGSLDSMMAVGLLVSMVTFTLLYVYMVIERYTLRRSEASVDELFRLKAY